LASLTKMHAPKRRKQKAPYEMAFWMEKPKVGKCVEEGNDCFQFAGRVDNSQTSAKEPVPKMAKREGKKENLFQRTRIR